MKLFDIEAEYSVLGSMIVQPSFIFRGVELLQPEDFFKEQNKVLFRFIRDLIAEGYTETQLNEISFKDELIKRNLFEKVGGEEHLGYVVEFALDSYEKFESACKIVKDKALLRKIIDVAKHINEKVEETPDPDTLIDDIEKRVFSLSEERITNTLTPICEVIPEIVKKIEELASRREMVTGLPSGYTELDRMTSGFHDSDLIILAARPSMGKTAFALSIAYNIAVKEGKTVAFFSLEMSKEQIVTRLISQDSGVPLHKIRSGFLFPQEIDKILESADRIREAPIYIDDTPGITILEMRAKSRRLQSEKGLDLIIVDYLQLMRGIRRTESRQQEVSEISRSLKALAKELNVPLIALSQLSRQVEHRSDKRPQLSDLRESGCLTGDTLIIDADTGKRIPIKELVGKTFNTLALDTDLKIRKFRVTKVFPSGRKKVYLLKTRSGREIKASANHPFLKLSGWVRLDELKVGDWIAVPRQYNLEVREDSLKEEEVILLAHLIGDGCVLPKQPIHYTSADLENINIVKEVAERLYGIKGKVVKQENWYHLYLPSPYRLTHGKKHPITLLYERLDLKRVRAYEKELPEKLFECDNQKLKLFVKHLWATDGNISISKGNVSIYYSSTSKILIHQLQHLLLRLGILSKIAISKKENFRPTYQLHITDRNNQLKFLKEIGCFGSRGKIIPEAIRILSNRKYNPNKDVIPKEVWTLYVKRSKDRYGISWRELSKRINTSYCGSTLLKHGVSRERLLRIFEAIPDEILFNLATSDILWDEIVEIKELGEEEVYDMTVPEVHNFVANDVIVHNSIEQDADVVMFIHRPEVYKKNPDPEEQGIAEIIIAKQRNGPTGTAKLAFIKEFTRFENLEESAVQHVVEEEKEEKEEVKAPPEEPFIIEDNQFNFDDSEDYDFDF
ncbi:replicative DNA helicase [Desulfurobacterium thermolithotrophum DSM 11699]|uniref:Replicative DNA helicase n=1 Tax=Desulfurobacterium thermolithotrophum (strain DSM 11699 / BSA) TaxID=868864 RepID=F0S203_DESTD|nr:replicative DNA helicase [Desulfurobacterium thermolithotrophum]ADY74084.1 replicative DNA helicase [Desulfurobacterium thermolithotrophum DSM 11699]